MRILFILLALGMIQPSFSQDPASLMEEGRKLEQRLKDEDAFEKYKQVLIIQPSHQKAILKCAELSCAIGSRRKDLEEQKSFYRQAEKFTDAVLKLDSNNAEAYYMKAVVLGKYTEVEKKPEDLVQHVKGIKTNIDKSIRLNPQSGRTWHVLGKWHYEMVSLNAVKKAAMKLIFGRQGEASIDKAIEYMEKCRQMEPYYCLNFLDLARAYQFNQQYEKAISLLEQLSKLPTRRQSDTGVKAEGVLLLQKLQ